jgi:hypothetical protein
MAADFMARESWHANRESSAWRDVLSFALDHPQFGGWGANIVPLPAGERGEGIAFPDQSDGSASQNLCRLAPRGQG